MQPSSGDIGESDRPAVSVVVPCYNEQECLEAMVARLDEVCRRCEPADGTYEIVLVDDGSSDRTWTLMTELAQRTSALVTVKLSRNYGHQFALTAGLEICRGERILIIDADLQDPPELLEPMMARMDAGADVVYGVRAVRRGETGFKRLTAKAFYRLINRLSEVPIPLDTGDFRLMSRRALHALLSMPERHRFIRGMVSWVGFRQEPLEYERDPRFAGQTKYPLAKMLNLATDAIVSFSSRPLRLAGLLSLISAAVGLTVLTYAALSWLMGSTVSGWTSIVGAVSMFSAAQLLVLAVFGEYMGRMYEQVKGRPLYIVQEIRRGADAPGPRP